MNRQNSAKVVFALMASFASIATIPASANLPSEQLIASLDRYSHSPLTSSDYSMPEMDDVYSPVRIPEKKSAIDRDLRSGLHQAVRYLKGKTLMKSSLKKG